MKFDELTAEAKLHATIWFNSEYDAYNVNGEKEYEPYSVEEFADLQRNCYEWDYDKNGDRTWIESDPYAVDRKHKDDWKEAKDNYYIDVYGNARFRK